jgi:peptidoglycan-associated lipoprotein
VWDDNQNVGNYRSASARNLWGSGELAMADNLSGPSSEDFIPLKDEDLRSAFADGAIPQPKHSPGEFGSGLPGIDQFYSPSGEASSIFRTVYFNTDDHILRGKEYMATIDRIANYLKQHPNLYVFVSGNCDERAPESYNLALGTRRANYVRTLLVQKGIDSDRIHTISYGKEKPVDFGHNQEAWAKNRRADFKIFERN